VPLWGFSIQNEPTAVAPWPQCDYTPQYALELIRNHVMPVMLADHPELKLMIFECVPLGRAPPI
jgi:O-glycosyl hydrolase